MRPTLAPRHLPRLRPVIQRWQRPWRRAWLLSALAGLLALPVAQAAPVQFVPYAGSGNAVLFDASTGQGGWVGAIDEFPDPNVSNPLSLVSVVLFSYDAVNRSLTGSFEFTTSADLGSTMYGLLSGSTSDDDIFGTGGQFALDYAIQGGSGAFFGASGFGLAFLQFDPQATLDNYAESGLLVFSVPEPAALPWLALGLLALQRRARKTPASA